MLARQLEEEYYEELPLQPEPAPRKKVVKRRVVRRRPVHNNLRGRLAVIVMLVAAMAIMITARSSAIATKGFDLVQMRTEAAQLEKENAQLRIANAKLKNPTRIKEIAEKKLGMVVPENVYFAEGK